MRFCVFLYLFQVILVLFTAPKIKKNMLRKCVLDLNFALLKGSVFLIFLYKIIKFVVPYYIYRQFRPHASTLSVVEHGTHDGMAQYCRWRLFSSHCVSDGIMQQCGYSDGIGIVMAFLWYCDIGSLMSMS